MAKATLKQLSELIGRIDSGLIDKATLQRFLDNPSGAAKNEAKQESAPFVAPEIQIWKTIKIGIPTLRTTEEFLKALKAAGHEVYSYAKDIMEKPAFAVSAEEAELNLVVVSIAELGFPKGATLKEIYDRALSLGLELCPSEVGPQLRLQYTDQSKGEYLWIGMEPITDSGGDPCVFVVVRYDDGESWLSADYYNPDYRWCADIRWVFVRR